MLHRIFGFRARRALAAFTLAAVWPVARATEHSSRLKDLVSIEGVRSNQLVGYGLVVGLNGTGDKQQTLFPVQSLINMLERMGVNMASLPAGSITVKNTAAVIVTATLPPYAQPGTTVDATVSAIGDATNLQGGLLVLSTLRGVNGQVYGTVQGPVVTAGFVAGRSSNSTTPPILRLRRALAPR
jgi:flagellar P-ring protein precursor FlgI